MTRRRIYLALLSGWVALLLTLTSIPNPRFGPDIPHLDKVAHFGFYGVAGFLFALWRRESGARRRAAVAQAAVFIALLGAFDEIHQHWIPGRSMDFFDWVADLAGGGAGSLCSAVAAAAFPFLLTRENPPAPRDVTE